MAIYRAIPQSALMPVKDTSYASNTYLFHGFRKDQLHKDLALSDSKLRTRSSTPLLIDLITTLFPISQFEPAKLDHTTLATCRQSASHLVSLPARTTSPTSLLRREYNTQSIQRITTHQSLRYWKEQARKYAHAINLCLVCGLG